MPDKPSSPPFRVVIVGGSIAGLTLAHCLLRKDIDFVVLESHDEIAPQVGASIGLLPNGFRILDQLGLCDEILDATVPILESYFWTEQARFITVNRTSQHVHKRHGYPIAFVDRQLVLEVLYKHLGQAQERVLTGKKVVKMDHRPDGIKVHCSDQTVFEGDLVVGADGVRSVVRHQMWEYMESKGLEREIAGDRQRMVSNYSCVFGISEPTPGLEPGIGHRTCTEGWSFLESTSREGRVYWFLFKKLGRKYFAHEVPRFDQANIDQYVEPFLEKPISNIVSFRDIYKRAISTTLVPLEEACYEHWAIDRWACIGDSVHKMTPNLGQGGNSAIESAASLANAIVHLIESSSERLQKPTTSDLHASLQKWQNNRRPRAMRIFEQANTLTRLEAVDTFADKIKAHYLMPYLESVMTSKMTKSIVGAVKVDYLPMPVKALRCKVPYNDSRSRENTEGTNALMYKVLERALWAVPLLVFVLVARGPLERLFALGGIERMLFLE
ncbi:FAD-dependent oxidoreductase [Aspergillus stella-maris]|uniref:FAD-dependent oxidoreductase n=1 Tax=Aspergillus stella-maris TaxID=1810926 RepID=UPI003CCDA42C